jgi:hypothetical protein
VIGCDRDSLVEVAVNDAKSLFCKWSENVAATLAGMSVAIANRPSASLPVKYPKRSGVASKNNPFG